MNNGKYYFLLFVVILLTMGGCKGEPSNELSKEKLEKEISNWSSKKYQGRQTGTKANNQVRDEIATQFSEMELEPIETKRYLMPFEMNYYNPQKIQTNLVVILNDGKKREFPYGKDWMEQSTNNVLNIELPISFSDNKNSILITDEPKKKTENVKVKFIRTETFHKQLNYLDSGVSSFQISDSFYTYLKLREKEIKNIHLTYSAQSEKITTHNVAGKITGDGGKVGKQAIILSAHFDHVGTVGDTTFLGAVDNATGLTGLINLASILKEDSKKKRFASDILFVAFNAEENGLVGSKAFIDKISSQYDSIININLDCIGIKDGGRISFVGKQLGSDLLSRELNRIASEKKIDSNLYIEEEANLTSDHISFINAGYQAINISQERFEKIHTIEDNKEYVDSRPLKSAIEIINDFVQKYHNTKFDKIDSSEPSLVKEIKSHKKGLNFAEYVAFPSLETRKVEMAYNLGREMSKKEVSQTRSSSMNDSVKLKLLNAQLSYEPNNLESLKSLTESTDSVGEVKKMRSNDYKLATINLTIQIETTKYYIQIFEGKMEKPEKNHKQIEIEKVGSWNLLSNNEAPSGEETYSTATSTINLNDRILTALIQNYDVETDTSVDPYNKSEIENLVTTFHPEPFFKFFVQKRLP